MNLSQIVYIALATGLMTLLYTSIMLYGWQATIWLWKKLYK